MDWLGGDTMFLGMIFVAVFLLAQAFVLPAFGENRQARRRLRKRLLEMSEGAGPRAGVSLVRQKYLRDLSPLERRLEGLPGMRRLEEAIEQAGMATPAYQLVLKALAFGAVTGSGAWLLAGKGAYGILSGIGVGVFPLMQLQMKKRQRLMKFEEQLPEALTVMVRSLRAGHPFSEAVRMVAEETFEPISKEFGLMFTEINYGADMRNALFGLLERVPSVTVMALVSSVLIQRDTGGNLAELMENLATLVRERFRFQRRVRTLSAQGRMAAWVLSLLPFGLAAGLYVTNRDLLSYLVDTPTGRELIIAFFVLMIIGILWISRIVRIDV
jgi:tight adherence protein B